MCTNTLVCLQKSASRRDGAVMLSKRRRKIQRKTPISSTGPSPLARWRIALCSGARSVSATPQVSRGYCLETGRDLLFDGIRHGDGGRLTLLRRKRAMMAGQPRVFQAMCCRNRAGFRGRGRRTKSALAGFVLRAVARDEAAGKQFFVIEWSSF